MTEKEEALVRAIWKNHRQCDHYPDVSKQETKPELEEQTKQQAS